MMQLLLVIFVILKQSFADEDVFLKIPQGELLGVKTQSYGNNVTYYSFRAIPYVKPNLGPDKFNLPEKPEPWEEVFNATAYGEPCPFVNNIFDIIEGTEDCLRINVETPSLANDSCKTVMVFIQGGGFQYGSANIDLYSPDFLIEHDVVLVTFSYRLGPIGFLSTQDEVLPGNLGLKDQVYALRWVRENIAYFNGCPDKITAFGTSAGASSLQMHMLSPMSKGLFRNAILQSGSAADSWAFIHDAREKAFNLGKMLGINTNDSRELIDKMKILSAENIVKAGAKTFSGRNGSPSPYLPYVPTVEFPVEGQESFMPDNPVNLILSGQIADTPFITGVNLDEGAFLTTNIINTTKLLISDDIEFKLDFLIRQNTNITDENERLKLMKTVYEFYFGPNNEKNLPENDVINLNSDLSFFNQFHFTTKILSTYMKSPIYKYLITFRTKNALLRPIFQMNNEEKIAHGDEIGFLFYSDLFGSLKETGESEEKMSKMILKMWTDFAKYENPTPEINDVTPTKWEPMDKKTNNILNINLPPKMQTTFFPERMSFWAKIYKNVLGKFADIM